VWLLTCWSQRADYWIEVGCVRLTDWQLICCIKYWQLFTVQFSISDCISSGVRQGCILAPALFCCATDWLMRQCRGKLGIQVGSSTFTDINYADDAVLFTADPAEWEEVLLSYETAANTMGLHCNWQKTKIQNVGAGPAPPPVQMENQWPSSLTLAQMSYPAVHPPLKYTGASVSLIP